MNYWLKSILSVILIGFGAINFYTMYELLGRSPEKPRRFFPEALKNFHRYSGYFFILIFAVISFFCLMGVVNDPFDFSPRGIVHALLALTIPILLASKLLAVKFYRGFYAEAAGLGKSAFALSLLLFAVSGGYYFLLMYPQGITGTLLVQNKCVRCHTLERVFSISKSKEGWEQTVARMADRVPGWISTIEKEQIIDSLVKTSSDLKEK